MILRRIFSRRVGYAAHALCLLASRDPAAAFPLGELAQHMARSWPGTSASYLSKVLQALVHGGILVSLRGSAGGYGFARPPAELSLLDIVGALEGPQDADCPLTPKGPCLLRQRCGNHRIEEGQRDGDACALKNAATGDVLLGDEHEPPN